MRSTPLLPCVRSASRPRRRWVLCLALLAGCVTGFTPSPAAAQEGLSVVYLVRHAERADQGVGPDGAMLAPQRDPDLSEAGRARARLVAGLLRDVVFQGIYATPFARTRQTAEPVATGAGLAIREYDPRDEESLAALIARLRAVPGNHLVVGHSNTTPMLVGALGGEPGGPIAEDEYDRLYVVTLAPDGPVHTALLRIPDPGVP